jgi:hypothetical protein
MSSALEYNSFVVPGSQKLWAGTSPAAYTRPQWTDSYDGDSSAGAAHAVDTEPLAWAAQTPCHSSTDISEIVEES